MLMGFGRLREGPKHALEFRAPLAILLSLWLFPFDSK